MIELPPSDEDWTLLLVLVEAARLDGVIAPLELAFLERTMSAMGVPKKERHDIRRLLHQEGRLPPVLEGRSLPSYAERLHLFEEGLAMCFADGVLHTEERKGLTRLVDRLDLREEDEDEVWDAAWQKHLKLIE